MVAVIVVIPLIVLLLIFDQRGDLGEDVELSRRPEANVPGLRND